MSRYARHRRDANHSKVVQEAEKCGWIVRDTSQLDDYFDAVLVKGGRIVFAEVKDGAKPPSKRKLKANQVDLHELYRRAGAEVVVLASLDDLQQLERPSANRWDDRTAGTR
jgi:hypothetical protein